MALSAASELDRIEVGAIGITPVNGSAAAASGGSRVRNSVLRRRRCFHRGRADIQYHLPPEWSSQPRLRYHLI